MKMQLASSSWVCIFIVQSIIYIYLKLLSLLLYFNKKLRNHILNKCSLTWNASGGMCLTKCKRMMQDTDRKYATHSQNLCFGL